MMNRRRYDDRFYRKHKAHSSSSDKLSSLLDRRRIRKAYRPRSEKLSQFYGNQKIEAASTRYPAKEQIDMLSALPEDIVMDILVRLPVKPLLMLRCVSKFWNSFISSKRFVKTHLEISARNPNPSQQSLLSISTDRWEHTSKIWKQHSLQSLVYDQHSYAADISFPTVDPTEEEEISVIGSCNGLCCFYVDEAPNIVLFNPSTTKYWILPCIDCLPQYSEFTHTHFGFGVSDDGDYKVVCAGRLMVPHSRYPSYHMAIYNLKTNSWKLLHNKYFCSRKSRGLFVNGKLHWIVTNRHTDGYSIVSFDLGTETDRLIDLPNNVNAKECNGFTLEVLGGSLCLVLDYPKISKDMWLLKEYGINESWIKVFSVPNAGKFIRDFKPLCMSVEGELLFVDRSTFTIYNSKNQSFKCPRFTNFPRYHNAGHLDVTVYVESLVSPFPHAE